MIDMEFFATGYDRDRQIDIPFSALPFSCDASSIFYGLTKLQKSRKIKTCEQAGQLRAQCESARLRKVRAPQGKNNG